MIGNKYRGTWHAGTGLTACAGAILMALAAGGAGAQTPAAEAAPPQYTVEIVIFRTLQPLGIAEDWTVQAPREAQADEDNNSDAIDLSAPPARVAVQPVSAGQFKLAGTDAALRRSANYQVLAHVAWTQPATPRGANAVTALPELGIADSALRGTVGLEQGRYLYLDLDLAWTPAQPPSSLLAVTRGSAPVTFTLKHKRRVRPFEQHYIDHPAFGVIAIVSPAG